MVKDWSPVFVKELKFLVRVKEVQNSFQELTLHQLEWIYTKLTGKTPAQSVTGTGADRKVSVLRAEWEAWKSDYNYEVQKYMTMCSARKEDRHKKIAWDLDESHVLLQASVAAVGAFMQNYFLIRASDCPAPAAADEVHDCMSSLHDVDQWERVPTLAIWDLNTSQDEAHEVLLVNAMLKRRPPYTACLIIHRQRDFGSQSKFGYHGEVGKQLDHLGIELHTVAFHLKDQGKRRDFDLVTAWVAVVRSGFTESIWAWTELVRGYIGNVDVATAEDMRRADLMEDGAPKDPRQMSRSQRLGSCAAVSSAGWQAVAKAAFGDMTELSVSSGVATAKNTRGQPVVAIVAVFPVSLVLPQALMKTQRQHWNGGSDSFDLRVLLLCASTCQEGYENEVHRCATEHWQNGDFNMPGHVARRRRSYVSQNGSLLSMEHKVTRIHEGKLVPLDAGVEKFQHHPAFREEVSAFLHEVEAQRSALPLWVEEEARPPDETLAPATEAASWASRFSTLEQLTTAPLAARATSKDSKIQFVVTQDGEGWAYALQDVTVASGGKALGWGAGKRVEGNANVQSTHSGVPYAIESDAVTVYYEKEGNVVKMTLHGLLNQLALEGKKATLKYHDVTAAADGTPGRYTVKPVGERHWSATSPIQSETSDVQTVKATQLLRFISAGNLKNRHWQIGWDVTVAPAGRQYTVVMERPLLLWKNPATLNKNTWFRWG